LNTLPTGVELNSYLEANGYDPGRRGQLCSLAARNLGKLAAAILARRLFAHCIVSGGDTAAGVLAALNCRELLPQAELMPGVPVSLLPGTGPQVNFVSKAGGFGSADFLLQARRILRGEEP
jgi:uncharacterized protein YgbK (DUF1537 family)